MNLFAGQQQRCRHRKKTYGHGLGVEGESKTPKSATMKRNQHANSTPTLIERKCEAKKVAGTRSNLKINFCFGFCGLQEGKNTR